MDEDLLVQIESIIVENEKRIEEETHAREKFYRQFQGAANAVAKVYTGTKQSTQQTDTDTTEEHFKNAAQSVTLLYRDCTDHSLRMEGLARSSNRKMRDVLQFLQQQKQLRRNKKRAVATATNTVEHSRQTEKRKFVEDNFNNDNNDLMDICFSNNKKGRFN